jgi:translation initiation factor 2D
LVDLNFDKFSPHSGKKGHEVLLQGGVIDDLAKHLIEQYGIPKRYIEVLDKTRK